MGDVHFEQEEIFVNQTVTTVESHSDWERHSEHSLYGFDEDWVFVPSVEDWDDGGQERSVDRYVILALTAAVVVLGIISSAVPGATHVLNTVMLIAVIVVGAGTVALFAYLIGTSVRSACWFQQLVGRAGWRHK
jgi:hypothetical protein